MDVLAICTNIPFNDLSGEQSIPWANVQNSVKDTGSAWILFRADQHQWSNFCLALGSAQIGAQMLLYQNSVKSMFIIGQKSLFRD